MIVSCTYVTSKQDVFPDMRLIIVNKKKKKKQYLDLIVSFLYCKYIYLFKISKKLIKFKRTHPSGKYLFAIN